MNRHGSGRERCGRLVSIQTTSERGGAEYANVDLLAALVARGHDVVLVTNLPSLTSGTDVRARLLDLGPKLSRRNAVRVVLRTPLNLLGLARALRAERPVAVSMVHFKKEQLLCSLLPRRLTGQIVWFEWGPLPVPMRGGLPRLLYSLAARRIHRVVAVSEGTRRTIVDAGVSPEKVIVVPNFVETPSVASHSAKAAELRTTWGAGERALVIGCISRLQRRKRNDVVIDAMLYLDDDVLLVIAGEGDEEATLRKRAAPHGERVRFVPNVRGQVEAFVSACDVLVFAPSPTEGEPRVIVIAQLMGVPVVATAPEGSEGLVQLGAGTIVSPPHDPRALAKALAGYRDDPGRIRREGAVAREAMLASHDPERVLGAVADALGLSG